MNPQHELDKMKDVLKSGTFMHKGKQYKLDKEKTDTHPLNSNLSGKPLMKFVGADNEGKEITVWSHDVQAVPVKVKGKKGLK